MKHVVVDVAGAQSGGAARYRAEFSAYLTSSPVAGARTRVIGRGQRLSKTWLVRREAKALGARHRVATNSAAFVAPGGRSTVVLRNRLHFLNEEERGRIPGLPSNIDAQGAVVRRLVSQADRVVTPTEAMRRAVLRVLPHLEGRLVARYHPLTIDVRSLPPLPRALEHHTYAILPGLPSIHKDLRKAAEDMVHALEAHDASTLLAMTCTAEDLQWNHERITFVGRLSLAEMLAVTAGAGFSFLPTQFESFGYPLAEARALGVPIVAPDSLDTLDVGGAAAVAFTWGDRDSLAEAVSNASRLAVRPDPAPFDARSYFDWLTEIPARPSFENAEGDGHG